MGQESNEDGFLSRRSGMVFKNVSKVPYQMKLEMKEVLQQLVAKKKVDIARSRAKVASTSRISSSWKRVDSQNSDSQPSPSPTTSSFPKRKGACLGKTSRSLLPPPTRFLKPISAPKPIPVMSPIVPHFHHLLGF
ncbi:hypothetical protein MTR_6g059540 [Medicago truncatula]|uniref:Uncharacterized protein n=1 Tax=Medicago truncatula TaxID=3880 RepID=G7KMH7_MEDTR|nr:hypothetical protein MTR_6g059540 [Medicago truncatula]